MVPLTVACKHDIIFPTGTTGIPAAVFLVLFLCPTDFGAAATIWGLFVYRLRLVPPPIRPGCCCPAVPVLGSRPGTLIPHIVL